jgi:hypothetical protein
MDWRPERAMIDDRLDDVAIAGLPNPAQMQDRPSMNSSKP